MLTLYLEHPVSQQIRRLGPAPYFRITAENLFAGTEEAAIGTYQNGVWTVDGDVFLTIAADAPARVRFEGNGGGPADYGPFEHLKVVDGAIRHGPNSVELLARLDEGARLWYVYAEQKHCPTAVLSAE
jgi:hypothetical protein